MAGLTVLDASVLLAHFDGTDRFAADARTILEEAGALAASTITLAESLVGAANAGRLSEQLRVISELEIDEVPLEPGSAAELARIRAETRLRMPDCCVLYAAQVSGADAVATRDGRLSAEARGRGFETP